MDFTRPDLGPFDVQHNADMLSDLCGRFANAANPFSVFIVCTVREVQTSDVQTSLDQLCQRFKRFARRTNRCNNLGFSHVKPSLCSKVVRLDLR
ncbi:DNA replication and repair protein RecF [Alicyclobacillus hesperidum URH17-3-68]|nr:DNA replication and repair protein RecF [Alicyclobacillus hesperidum URH17-3-68]